MKSYRWGRLMGLAAMLLGAGVAFAQEDGPAERGDAPAGRQPARRFSGQRMDAMRYTRALENFEQEVIRGLEADEELTGIIHDIFAKHLAPLKEQTEQRRSGRRDNAGDMRELMDEMRQAQESGDTEKIRELRERLAQMRQSRDDYEPVHEALFEDIRAELHDEELTRFDALAERFEARLGDDGRNDEMRRIRLAVAGLNLSPEQRNRVREVIRDHARRGMAEDKDPQKAEDQAKSLREAIAAELDEEQATQFEKTLAELEQRDKNVRDQGPGAAVRHGPATAPGISAPPGAATQPPPADEAAPPDDGGSTEEAGHSEPPE